MERENAELFDHSKWDFQKQQQSVDLIFSLKARSNSHFLTQHGIFPLLQASYHNADCKAMETNWYKRAEVNFQKSVLLFWIKNLINNVRKYRTYLLPKWYPCSCHCIHQVPAHLQLLLWTGKFLLSSWLSMCKYWHRSHCKPPSTRTSLCWWCQTASCNGHSKITQACH